MKYIKIFLRKKKKKNDNMVVSVTKISQKMENKSSLSIEKNILEQKKTLYYDYNNDLKSSFEAVNLVQKANLNEKKIRKL